MDRKRVSHLLLCNIVCSLGELSLKDDGAQGSKHNKYARMRESVVAHIQKNVTRTYTPNVQMVFRTHYTYTGIKPRLCLRASDCERVRLFVLFC